jgi:hypothetical protein
LKLRFSSVVEPLLNVMVQFAGRLTGLESGTVFRHRLCNCDAVSAMTNWLIEYTPPPPTGGGEGTTVSMFRRACTKAMGLLLAEKGRDGKPYIDRKAFEAGKDPGGQNWLKVEDMVKGFSSADVEVKFWLLHILDFSLVSTDFLNAVGPLIAPSMIQLLEQAALEMATVQETMLKQDNTAGRPSEKVCLPFLI